MGLYIMENGTQRSNHTCPELLEHITDDQSKHVSPDIAATLDVTPEEITIKNKEWKIGICDQFTQEGGKKHQSTMRGRSGTWPFGPEDIAISVQTSSDVCESEINKFSQNKRKTVHNDSFKDFNSSDSDSCGDVDPTKLEEISLNDVIPSASSLIVQAEAPVLHDSKNSEFTDVILQPFSRTEQTEANNIHSTGIHARHSNRQSLDSIFGWISSKNSPVKTAQVLPSQSPSSSKNSSSSKTNYGTVLSPSTKSSIFSKTKFRPWRRAADPPSTTALILENRPRNLPEKPHMETAKHKIEYEKMIKQVKKSEGNDIKKKNKQLKMQHMHEEVIMSTSAIWIKEILPNWNNMHQTSKTKQLWWDGLPPNVRGKVWQLAIGNELNITQDLYEIMVIRAHDKLKSMHDTQSIGEETESLSSDRESTVELITLDISRTFPTLCIFQKGGPYHNILHDILGAYVCYRPDIGYVQGMSFIAAMLLLNMEPCNAFTTFANLLNKPCQRTFFQLHEDQMKAYFAAFEVFFEENLPQLFSHFKQNNLSPDMYLIDWIFTMFSKALTFDTACRVWDMFCRDGEEFLFKCAIAILKLHQEALVRMEFIYAAQFLTRLPSSVCSHQELFRHVSEVTLISRSNRHWKDVLSLLKRDENT